jgi:hypothetical protein
MDLKKMECEGMNWIRLAPVAGSREHGSEPTGCIRGKELVSYLGGNPCP